MRFKTSLFAAGAAVSMLLGGCASQASEALSGELYTGFTLIDPSTEQVRENAWLVVDDGRIAALGEGPAPSGTFTSVRDMAGLYALPGFIDVHGHIVSGPHGIEVIDGQPTVTIESVDEVTEFHARMALAFGVTTIRNTGGDPQAAAEYDARIASGEWIGPRTYHAGAVMQPAPFGGNAFVYPTTEEEWQAEAARQAALGMTYFKLYHGLTEEEIATGIRVAHEHGLQAIADLEAVSWTRAAELGLDGVLHAKNTSPDLLEPGAREAFLEMRGPDARYVYQWFELVDFDGPLMQEMFETLARENVTSDMTLLVNTLFTGPGGVEAFLAEENARYLHPATRASMEQFLQLSLTGWTEEDTVRAEASMDKVFELVRRMDAAGIRLGIGTDGNGGGPYYERELQLHLQAGLSPWRVLQLATQGGAELIGIEDATGRLAAGYEADIVFLAGDPLQDMAHTRDVAWVVTDGNAHRFSDLTADANAESD